MAKPILKELKDEIITKINMEGLSGVEGARCYGINVKNMYRWLDDGVNGTSRQAFELNHLKREIQQLKQLIGQLLLDHEREKKDWGSEQHHEQEQIGARAKRPIVGRSCF